MSDNCDIKQRWSDVDRLLTRWLAARQDLIVQYCGLSGVQKLSPSSNNCARLRKLCGLLVDYVSAGHFEVYHELLREGEAFDDGGAARATAILANLQDSTAAALHFDEQYGEATSIVDAGLLAKDLSRLGESMAARFELEDRLVAILHHAHQTKVA